MFDDQLVEQFINYHYGYGDYDAKYWFVGMEERGGKTPKDIVRRLNAWHSLGRGEMEDLVEYHRKIHKPELFEEPVAWQPTWGKIIRVLLTIEGIDATTPNIKNYQMSRLARKGSESCLIELFPSHHQTVRIGSTTQSIRDSRF